MPIDRTAYNALVDEGPGGSPAGSTWGKVPIKDVVLDPVDAELAKLTPIPGAWINVPFNAGDFVGGGGIVWTVDAADVKRFAYQLIGKTMTVSVWLQSTTVAGVAGNTLTIKIPGGKVAVGNSLTTVLIGAFDVVGFVYAGVAGTVFNISPLGTGTHAPSTNNTCVIFTLTFEVQ